MVPRPAALVFALMLKVVVVGVVFCDRVSVYYVIVSDVVLCPRIYR
jgi:hypothetical protein